MSVERDVKFGAIEITIPGPLIEGERQDDTTVINQPASTPNNSPIHIPTEPRPKRTIKPSEYVQRLQSGEGTTKGHYRSGKQVGTSIPHGIQTPGVMGAFAECVQTVEMEGTDFAMISGAIEGPDPLTLHQAKRRDDWPKWEQAILKELKALEAAKTWTLVKRPPDKNIISSKWVFVIKYGPTGEIIKYKARLVARGFTQIHGVDYTETFAPVAKLSSFRMLLAMAARRDWPIEVFDFNSAFLNGRLEEGEELYMDQPPGYEKGKGMVAKLHRTIYGLKQAGWKWYETLVTTLLGLGFQRAESDFGVFYIRHAHHSVVLAIHVDDCTIAGTSTMILDDYKQRIGEQFGITDLGPIHWLLGIQITRNRLERTISLSQRKYIDSILSRFNLTEAQPLFLPFDPHVSLSRSQCPTTPDDISYMKKVPYREAIGSLMYLAVGTRPDIAFAVSTLSQYL